MENFKQIPEMPAPPFPIAIIGTGGIVKDAHLPAYEANKFPVMGIYDINSEKAKKLKSKFPIVDKAYSRLDDLIEAATAAGAVYDLAVPASSILDTLKNIPNNSAVLIQKPMGENLAQAVEIMELCKNKNLISAVNFQLPYAPYMLAARDIIDKNLIGEIYDIEFMVCVYTPWHLWDFLFQAPRVEILYHSIHYIDLIRRFIGNPEKIYASTIKHPAMEALASTRSTIILDYNSSKQARIITNHGHDFGLKHQQSYCKIEGTRGAIKIRIGLSLDYPRGKKPKMEYFIKGSKNETWTEIPLKGGWFPHAFIGTMAELQNYYMGKKSTLPHSTANSLDTMKIVEAAYFSSEKGGVFLKNINP